MLHKFFFCMISLQIMNDPTARKYVSGVALHWYMDNFVPTSLLDATNKEFPDLFLLGSEACAGFLPGMFHGPRLGYWNYAEQYARDIIEVISVHLLCCFFIIPKFTQRFSGHEPLGERVDGLEPGFGRSGWPVVDKKLRWSFNCCKQNW